MSRVPDPEIEVNRLRAVEGIWINKVLTGFLRLLLSAALRLLDLIAGLGFLVFLFLLGLLDFFVLLSSAFLHLLVDFIFIHEVLVVFVILVQSRIFGRRSFDLEQVFVVGFWNQVENEFRGSLSEDFIEFCDDQKSSEVFGDVNGCGWDSDDKVITDSNRKKGTELEETSKEGDSVMLELPPVISCVLHHSQAVLHLLVSHDVHDHATDEANEANLDIRDLVRLDQEFFIATLYRIEQYKAREGDLHHPNCTDLTEVGLDLWFEAGLELFDLWNVLGFLFFFC